MDQSNAGFAAWIGIDWADRKHVWTMHTHGEQRPQRGTLDHTSEAIEDFFAGLALRFPGRLIAVALEQSRGKLLFALMKYQHLVLFPIHPSMLDHYRKGWIPSGAKSDPVDSDLIVEVLIKHGDRLRPYQPDTVETRTLQFLVEARRDWVDDRTRHINRLRANLKVVFPQCLEWFDRVDSVACLDLLSKWPTLQAFRAAKANQITAYLDRHRFSIEKHQRIREAAEKALPTVTDAAVLEAGTLQIKALTAQLGALNETISTYEIRISSLTESHPCYSIFSSFPCTGDATTPRLVAGFGTDRGRYEYAVEIQNYSGISPVTVSSGKQRRVHWRWACPGFLRQTFHEWAWCSTRKCEWARGFYDLQRARGKSHHAAVRSLAYKWLRIMFRCWKDNTPYDEARYLAAVNRRAVKKPPTGEAPPVKILSKSECGFTTITGIIA
jgi:transposase